MSGRKTGILVLFALFFGGIWVCSSLEWPVAEGRIVSNFAKNIRGEPALGYSFHSEGPVRAADSGELLFTRQDGETRSGLPSPLGDWTAIEHRDGLVGIYGRFSLSGVNNVGLIDQGGILGFSGRTGWGDGDGFYFSFYDRREKHWVNPGMILPLLDDTLIPQIRSVRLENGDGRLFRLPETRSIPRGQYRIIVETQDFRREQGDEAMECHRITCAVNGKEAGEINFETFAAQNGRLVVNAGNFGESSGISRIPASTIYAFAPAIVAGEVYLNSGQAIFEIIGSDLKGQSRSQTYRLNVE
jgi:hypothetical protein